ncbi:hypothetical protein GQF01_16910 [Paenibacillus sp. 5J-6]|uniref:SLH domain-containing protein n=1 Tax=Paenibacillus silvestris TaxID=2606219 RepID=A0A6L8V005_9BACL|nr:S-layer homology domain-containing protein [Paenibacillus silvestris]MZQ83793.1 hypothetical protein [Paenibacillus silvestris]
MLLQDNSHKNLVGRASATIVLLLMLNLFTPLLASAASFFNFQFNPVSGEVYGYIYSDQPSVSVSMYDETYGTRSVVQNMNSEYRGNGSYYYNLDGTPNNALIGLKPVTASVYENPTTPIVSTLNNVSGNVYTYGNSYTIGSLTGLHAEFNQGSWEIKWDPMKSPAISGIKEYRNGYPYQYSMDGMPGSWKTSYIFGSGVTEYQYSLVDVFGHETPLSEKLVLEADDRPDGYVYHGNIYLNGYPAAGTQFVVKDRDGEIVYNLAYEDHAISDKSDLGSYSIFTTDPGGSDKYLECYFSLPSADYHVEVTNSVGDTYKLSNYETDLGYPSPDEGKFSLVNLSDVIMQKNFKSAPIFHFNNKEVGHWLAPNEDIVSFTPSRSLGNQLTVYFPYDRWHTTEFGENNSTTIQEAELQASDVQLIKKSDNSIVPITNWIHARNLYQKGLITFMLDKELKADEEYVLRMSSTSKSNEIKLPTWPGSRFSAGLATSKYQVSYFTESVPGMYEMYEASESITIKSPPIVQAPVVIGGGGGGGYDSKTYELTDDGAKLKPEAMTIAKENGVDGKEVSIIRFKSDSVRKAIDALKENDNKHTRLTLGATDTDNGAKIEISASELNDAITSKSNVLLSIQTDAGTYHVPVSVFNHLAEKFQGDLKDVKLTISITKASEKSYEVLKRVNPDVKPLLVNPIEFNITAEKQNGSKVEVNDFGGTYIERIIISPNVVDGNTTVVSYDPTTGKMVFIPAVFRQVNGKSEVTIKSSHNSIYTLVEMKKSFQDVQGHWAQNDIDQLASKFILQGTDDQSFEPNQYVSRAQFASMLVSALGLIPDDTGAAYNDVKASDWFAGAVGTAAKKGLVQGNESGQFQPNELITREQMVVMISRAIQFAGKGSALAISQDNLSKYTDGNEISDWAKGAVGQTIHAKIVNGLTESRFAPQDSATRAQAAVMLKRFLQYVQFIN